MKNQKVFVDHQSASKFIMKEEYITKAEELLNQIAGKNSNNKKLVIFDELKDDDDKTLIARNWPNQQKIDVNWRAWLTIGFSYKSRSDSKLLKQAIAVHEILSLHPLKIEYTNSYSVSFLIIAYYSKNASAGHQHGIYSVSDLFGMANYYWRNEIDLNALPNDDHAVQYRHLLK
jgi:hypothetical protein